MELLSNYAPEELVQELLAKFDDLNSLIAFSLTSKDAYDLVNNDASYKLIAEKFLIPSFTSLKLALEYNKLNLEEKLLAAVKNNDLQSVKTMTEYDPNKNLEEALYSAAEKGYLDIVIYLLDLGANNLSQAVAKAASKGAIGSSKILS